MTLAVCVGTLGTAIGFVIWGVKRADARIQNPIPTQPPADSNSDDDDTRKVLEKDCEHRRELFESKHQREHDQVDNRIDRLLAAIEEQKKQNESTRRRQEDQKEAIDKVQNAIEKELQPAMADFGTQLVDLPDAIAKALEHRERRRKRQESEE